MAVNRLDPGRESPEPKAAAAAPAAPASTGGFKTWLPLMVTIVTMPLLAYAATMYVLLPKLQQGLNMTPGQEPSHKAGGATGAGHTAGGQKKEIYSVNKLLVNVAGTMGSRYLMTSLALAGSDPDFKAKLQQVEPQLRDMACGALSTKTIADIEKPGARNLVRSELISGFNNILGGSIVEDIYLTEFAIQ